jgi:hypothetical protein
MYSGIGSFVKKYNTGGEALTVTDPQNGSGANLSFEQWKASLEPSIISGMTDEQLRALYNATAAFSGRGRGNTTTVGAASGKVLPDYMKINAADQVLIAEGMTNRQFIEAMNMLGLLPEDDYAWLTQYFTGENGDATWLAARYNQPDTNINRDNFFGNNNLNSENTSIMNRLFDVFDAGSQAGGFTASPSFLATYTDGLSVGSFGDSEGGATTSTYTPRPLTLGPRPTGGVEGAPYYSLSDVLVSSSEQPNLYDRFDPYPEGGLSQVNPYTGQVTTQYSYRPPSVTTPSLTFDTGEADPVTGTVGEPDTTTTTTGTGGTGLGGDGTTTTDTTTTDTTTGTTDTTTTDTTTTTTAPTAPLTGYQGIAAFKDQDPYLFGKRGMVQGLEALAGSRRDLTAEEFQSLLSGQQGRYGEGSTLAYDPRFGVYSTISDAELQRLRETQSVPDYIDPRLMTDVERIRSNQMGGGTYSRSVTDEAGNVYKIGRGRQTTRIGDTQYFMNEDGSVTAYDVKDIKYDRTPKFGGFADGGIVSIAGDIANMQTTGEGIESFLNPERSKATLRRNLAKLAPRPTAPVMQQGIMPMAR